MNRTGNRWALTIKTALLAALLLLLLSLSPAAHAAPPVRIAVVPGGGSGQEQEVVDHITDRLQELQTVALSTVNPDWYVVCNIKENLDQRSGQIHYNGTVIIKTADASGTILGTVAVQKYNQDFSLQPGAPLNKKLVDGAVREVIAGLSDRAMQPLQQAIDVEMETRDRMIKATELGQDRKYQEALDLLRPISPETPHFKQVRQMVAKYEQAQAAAATHHAAAKHH
jgi:hypothetical protein